MDTTDRNETIAEMNALLGYAMDERKQAEKTSNAGVALAHVDASNAYQARAMELAKILGYV